MMLLTLLREESIWRVVIPQQFKMDLAVFGSKFVLEIWYSYILIIFVELSNMYRDIIP
jgi:hypothetical protein